MLQTDGRLQPCVDVVVEIANCTPDLEASWDEYVYKHPDGTHCHLTAWREIFRKTYGHKEHYLIARAGSKTCGVLPLLYMKGLMNGGSLVSVPFLDSGGVLADNSEIEKHLLQQAVYLGKSLKAENLELRNTRPSQWMSQMNQPELYAAEDCWKRESGLTYVVRSHKVRMLMSLPENPEVLMTSFKSKLRSQIKRPLREGCETINGGLELVDQFYRVFAINMRDLGSPVHPKRLFANIFNVFGDEVRIFLVRKGSKTVAGSLVIGFRGILANPWASSLKEYSMLSPNMLLYWAMLEYACQKGFQYFDFGRSSPNGGTFRFKEQWGAVSHMLNWCYISLNGSSDWNTSHDRSRFDAAIACWKKLPVPLTRIIGPLIRKRIGL